MSIQIYLKDTDPRFKGKSYYEAHDELVAAGHWAIDNCHNCQFGVVEMSDVDSAACDWMGEYTFSNEKDAMWFKLKWG